VTTHTIQLNTLAWYRGDLTKIREKIHLERKERKKWKDCYMKGMSEQMQV